MSVKSPPTSSGTGRLSETARHVIVPSGITSTGWPAVRDKCLELGIEFDQWQDGAGRLILSKREDGIYATTIGGVVISIPRQVGKTFLIGAIVFALCMLFPNLTVIWTAHRLRTADETFSAMQSMAGRHRIKPFVKKILVGSGAEEIEFHNGSRILFGARERGFGRGFAEVDVLMFDEAQILTENAIDDMVPATNQAPNPLIIYTGTPPKATDPSEVFSRKRTEALAGESEDTAYIEFSADLGCDPMDREQWSKANPSYPKRTPAASMLRMKKNLSDDSYIREALGIWDDGRGETPLAQHWPTRLDPKMVRPSPPQWGLAVSTDRAWATIDSSDGTRVEVAANRQGTGWVVAECQRLTNTHGGVIALNPSSPAGSLLKALTDAGVPIREVGGASWAQACGNFHDAVMQSRISHRGDPELDLAVRKAVTRPSGESWVWSQRLSPVDIGPLCAAALAFHGSGSGREPSFAFA